MWETTPDHPEDVVDLQNYQEDQYSGGQVEQVEVNDDLRDELVSQACMVQEIILDMREILLDINIYRIMYENLSNVYETMF